MLVVACERGVLVGLLGVREDLEDPARPGVRLLLGEPPQTQLRVGWAPLSHEPDRMPEIGYGSAASSLASASRAASCSAAFFVCPSPRPSSSPSMIAAQVKRRSCGGPSTETSAYTT